MDLSKRMFVVASKIRWLMIALVILTLQIFAREKMADPNVYIPFLILILYNITTVFFKGASFRICYAESFLDTLFITSIIFSTGRMESPFYLFYLLIIMFGACYYRTLHTILLAFCISGIYLLIFLTRPDPLWIPYLMIRIPLFLATAGMCSFLVAETKLAEEELEDERQQAKMLQPKIQSTLYELSQESKRLDELYNISLKLEERGSFKTKLKQIIEHATHFLKTDFCLIFLFAPKTGRLEIEAGSGENIKFFPSFQMGEGLVGDIAKKGKTVVINDIYMRKERMYELFKEMKIPSLIAAPLLLNGINGVILCGSRAKKMFGDRDKKFIEFIAKIIALHLKNERLSDEINRLSICDKATALFAYSYFEEKLKEEFERSMRLLRPLSLIAVKIGAYQTFHSVDIQRIGLIINSQTRADDMITWNKGIFFILALRTGEEKIRILVDRVKNEMEVKVGVRPVIGIACYPSSVVTSHLELIRKAYSALAIAERQVDRIAVASEHGM